uniref:Uncharacterized protein n=1 Tax=Globisporangium ultimum (strain ATCC 200006 / CBS 805.95 / DAOM BR144) TaxID=431595 RepID=K3X069_GLOUD
MCVRAVSASVIILNGNGRSPEQNQTTPRNDTIYLTENGASFKMCANAPPEQAVIYGNTFMRYIFAQIVQDTSHNLTFLQESEFEMVAPVVDCTTTYFRFNIISEIYDEIMHADLLVIYISVSALAGKLLRVRVDPIVVLTAFEVGFKNRIQILQKVFPTKASDVGRENSITALASWSSQETTKLNLKVIFGILLPVFSTLIFVAAYILLSKAYRYFVPEALHVIRSNQTSSTNKSGKSGREEHLKQLREHFTIFELATGAELEHRFGMLSNYENCVFIHGVKHATADGIYSNGFVIANNKFLVQTQDVWSIVLMKILRYRFKNIFVFELEGTTVKKTARLVYPQTVAWTDLINLNVNPLS